MYTYELIHAYILNNCLKKQYACDLFQLQNLQIFPGALDKKNHSNGNIKL